MFACLYAFSVRANLALHIWREVTGSALIWERCLSLMLSDATEHALHKQLGHSVNEGQDSNSLVESDRLLSGVLHQTWFTLRFYPVIDASAFSSMCSPCVFLLNSDVALTVAPEACRFSNTIRFRRTTTKRDSSENHYSSQEVSADDSDEKTEVSEVSDSPCFFLAPISYLHCQGGFNSQ